MIFDAYSCKGVRDENQDSYVIVERDLNGCRITHFHHDGVEEYDGSGGIPIFFALVADGMGGLENGCRASYMTTQLLIERFLSIDDWNDREGVVRSAVIEISGQLALRFPGSGSTVVGMVSVNNASIVFNVGDSICLVGMGDRSCVLDRHRISPGSSLITDYIGMDGEPDVITMDAMGFHKIMLFSDGMENMYLFEGLGLLRSEDSARFLVERSLDMGSCDNIACVLVIKK